MIILPQNMLRLSVFCQALSLGGPSSKGTFAVAQIPHAHPPTAQHTHTHTLLLPTPPPVGVLDCEVEKWWWGVGDYASVRLVKGLPWSFCCVTDGWEAEQAYFA